MNDGDYVFTRQARSTRLLGVLTGIYALLIAAIMLVDAAPWLMALLALPTLPALVDFWRNPSAGIRLGANHLEWHTGARAGKVRLSQIDHFRFDTRWDFSQRVSVCLDDNKKIRLPYEAMPPTTALETELAARDIRVERHHFTVF